MTTQIRTPWPRLVVMGVSGAGKSTIASALAAELGLAFVDADDLHPESNIRKMRSGTPLDDADRWPWLEDVGRTLAAAPRPGAVTACSALRRSYRDVIRRFALRRSSSTSMRASTLSQSASRGAIATSCRRASRRRSLMPSRHWAATKQDSRSTLPWQRNASCTT